MLKIKYGIFSDIHSNLEALRVVLDDMVAQGVTHPICLGDIVGYNADPRACLRLVRELNCPVIKGNHDEMVAETREARNFNALAGEGIAFSRKRLSDDDKRWLAALPMSLRVGQFTVVHSSLDEPAKWNYVSTELEAESSFIYQNTPLCFYGHTHVARIFAKYNGVRELPRPARLELQRGTRYLINVGAVGQPRDHDWRASYVIYTPAENRIEYRRLAYDLARAQEKIRQAGLPEPLAVRIGMGA
ncbi:MAG: metallophosphatase family protein [Verrucomicrobiales bacterium]|jgi:predicted phosphodiesterase|nr:metallophosphatase family protein [Verrucomicrobiales bacterium]